jgi:hypothetical protein
MWGYEYVRVQAPNEVYGNPVICVFGYHIAVESDNGSCREREERTCEGVENDNQSQLRHGQVARDETVLKAGPIRNMNLMSLVCDDDHRPA